MFFGVEELKASIRRWFRDNMNGNPKMDNFKPIRLQLKDNPSYPHKPVWGQRPLSMINKIIVHQELADGDTESVHRYHISENSHLKQGGAPRIAYHFTVEKDGTVYQVNELKDIVWHCRGQNIESIGIMLCGNFDGPTHKGTGSPTSIQIQGLKNLLNYLSEELKFSDRPYTFIRGHCDFGKENCPGNEVIYFLRNQYRKGF